MPEYSVDGHQILVDEQDLPRLQEGSCSVRPITAGGMLYAFLNGKPLHRVLLDCPQGLEVDHINRQPLDNRRTNLRLCTKAENLRNRRGWTKHEHGYKGLYKQYQTASDRLRDKYFWEARISLPGRSSKVTCGSSVDPHKAALKWNRGAIAHYGEFRVLNEVPCQQGLDDQGHRCGGCHAQCGCCCVCPEAVVGA